ncbi:MAG: chemotaxis protein CheA [Candidatus Anammoxibacter sp.]
MFENKDDDVEIISEFITESNENLDDLDSRLLNLEKNPDDKNDILNHVFRAIHTVKGGSGFLSLDEITTLSHKLENILSDLRNDVLQLTPDTLDVVLEGIDALKKLLEILAEECESPGSTKEVEFDLAFILNKIEKIKEVDATESSAVATENTGKEETPQVNTETDNKDDDAFFQNLIEENKATFIEETNEYIETVDNDLIKLEKGEDIVAVTDNVFRLIHTIKGNAAYLGFAKIEKITHNFENILDELRKGNLTISNDICKLLFNTFDKFKTVYSNVVTTGKESEGDEDITGIITEISKVVAEAKSPAEDGSTPDKSNITDSADKENKASVSPVKDASDDKVISKPKETSGEKKKGKAVKADQTIRVERYKLDTLMNLIGELIINRNQFEMLSERIGSDYDLPEISKELDSASASLGKISDDLQSSIMSIRMIPVGTVFNKFPRIVRDLAKSKNKSIELKISGEETNLDKTIIEQIGDPLVHLIRNGVDHGIESPEDRKRAGKPPLGTLELRAFQKADNVFIEIEDNGKGMDPKVIRDKAVEKGMISKEDADKLSDEDAFNLIFEAGFSTAEKVTDISGRGVGMDVVRNNIRKLGGHVYIQSEKGKGSKFTLTLPLTLAIIRTIMVKLGNNTFAIPLNAIVETVKVTKAQIQSLKNKKVINLRGEVVGIVDLSSLIGIPQNGKDTNGNLIPIVIISVESKKIGLIVDDLLRQHEIVIKPLVDFLSVIPGLSGATILGDGKIVLILDPTEVFTLATASKVEEVNGQTVKS